MGADTLQSTKASLQILSAVVKAVPIPEPFKSAVVGIPDAVLQIIKIVETAQGNTEDAKVLAVFISTITDKTIRSLDLPHATATTQNRVREFREALQQIGEEIATLTSRRPLRKWINYDRDASTLSTLKQKVVEIITGVQLETVVATGHEVDMISRKQDSAHADHQAIIQQLDLVYQEQQVLIRKQQPVNFITHLLNCLAPNICSRQKSTDSSHYLEPEILAHPRSRHACKERGNRC
ncbi:hypothetical protein FRB94_013251 [Tulasnella sp. JGI-2019a]|nr:hypothetical protein FRB93_001958 [Tulasnella sp. JGI-2019a]KAG9008427.1 hypothetical protein FRB94_013251 [Tulasnella sp. JGI-2019a]